MRPICFSVLFLAGPFLFSQGISEQLQQLYRIHKLPQYVEYSRAGQFSSYDRTGRNDDGFSGTYSFLRKEGDDLVIAEMDGPGVITRIWTPTPSEDTIQFFLDGEENPRISIPFMDLFSGEKFPFTDPLCGHEVGGYYCYFPIPYKRSCKVVLKGDMLFYQVQYSSFPQGTDISSFSPDLTDMEKEWLRKVSSLWNSVGTRYLEELYDQVETEKVTISLRPGETKRVFEMSGGGRIAGLEVTGIDRLDKNDNRLLLKARWDGEKEWAIHAPVKEFFGYHFGVKSMRSLLVGTSGNSSYAWYPMPFSEKAVIELEYLGTDTKTEEREIGFTLYYTTAPRQPGEGKFYAHWRRERGPKEGSPYEILPEFRSRGHYVGTILNCQGLIPGTTGFFEGDDQATIDGEIRIHGTGSEDYFNGGWYAIPDRWDMAHSLPTHGCLGYTIPLSRTGGYRHYFNDKISFEESFKLTIEHGPEENLHPVDYSSVAFFYAENAPDQQAPSVEQVSYPEPDILKFPGNHLNILAFTHGRIINGERYDRRRVLIMEPMDDVEMLVKCRLEVPVDGLYKIYCSYYVSHSGAELRFSQRQDVLSDWWDLNRPEQEYMEMDEIGTINASEGYATVSFHVRGGPGSRFILHNLQLELKNPE